MVNQIFYTDRFKKIELDVKSFINDHQSFLSEDTIESPRAVGDAIQALLSRNFKGILGADICGEYGDNFARRAMADFAFADLVGNYHVIDVKTHRLSTKFNMPNLTSVERITRFYEGDENYFVVLMVVYDIGEGRVNVERVHFVPIEFLSWECLTVGALGWGQIQIANSNNVIIIEKYSRKRWMIELCDTMLEFYPREIEKIGNRVAHFTKIRQKWVSKIDPTEGAPKKVIKEDLA